jgi:predicted dehydrogenase
MYRHNPKTRRVADLVAAGTLGELRLIRSSFSVVVDTDNVRLQRGLDGGALMDLGCYCVSGARLLAGEPERVYAERILGGDGVDVAFAATLRFPGDVIAYFDCGLELPDRRGLEVVCDDATVYVADPWHTGEPTIELRRGDRSIEVITEEPSDPYALQIENFCAAIGGAARPLLGRDDALGQARAIAALTLAAGSGQAVSV